MQVVTLVYCLLSDTAKAKTSMAMHGKDSLSLWQLFKYTSIHLSSSTLQLACIRLVKHRLMPVMVEQDDFCSDGGALRYMNDILYIYRTVNRNSHLQSISIPRITLQSAFTCTIGLANSKTGTRRLDVVQ